MRSLAQDERSVFGALDREECLVLLRWESVGRLAVGRDGFAPVVVPVNFVLDGDTILFRTDAGDTALRLFEGPASFQVDRFDWYRRIGWSVLLQGTAQLLTGDEADALDTVSCRGLRESASCWCVSCRNRSPAAASSWCRRSSTPVAICNR